MQLLMYNATLYIDRLAKVGDIGGDQEAQKVYLPGQYSNQSSYFKSFWYTKFKSPTPWGYNIMHSNTFKSPHYYKLVLKVEVVGCYIGRYTCTLQY